MTELRTPQLRTTQLRTTQLSTTELRTTQLRTTQLQTTELRTTKLTMTQLKTVWDFLRLLIWYSLTFDICWFGISWHSKFADSTFADLSFADSTSSTVTVSKPLMCPAAVQFSLIFFFISWMTFKNCCKSTEGLKNPKPLCVFALQVLQTVSVCFQPIRILVHLARPRGFPLWTSSWPCASPGEF